MQWACLRGKVDENLRDNKEAHIVSQEDEQQQDPKAKNHHFTHAYLSNFLRTHWILITSKAQGVKERQLFLFEKIKIEFFIDKEQFLAPYHTTVDDKINS